MRRLIPILALGCGRGDGSAGPSPAQFVDGGGVDTFEISASGGITPHRVLVRALNRFGASVASDAQPATVDGVEVEVAFDGFGYGSVELSRVGESVVVLGEASASAHTVQSDWPGVEMHPAWVVPLDDPEWSGATSDGVVASSGSEVWWAGPDLPPHQVLETDEPVRGLRTMHIDADGLLDALVWTPSTAYLLRGRVGGGLAFGAAIVADELSVGGIDVGDVSGDNLPDVVIAWSDGTSGILDVLEGDGLFQFAPAVTRTIDGVPADVVINDATGEGIDQITVLHDTAADWSRFILGAERQYIPIGPFLPVGNSVFSAESRMIPSGDLDGDGGDEIALVEPRVSGNIRSAFFFDLLVDVEGCNAQELGAQCVVEYLPLDEQVAGLFTVGDANADGLDDVWILDEEGLLYGLHWSGLTSKYESAPLLQLPAQGPPALADVDADGSIDLSVATRAAWWQWRGEAIRNDERQIWAPRELGLVQVRESLHGLWGFTELDGNDSSIEIVGFNLTEGDTLLRVVAYERGGGRATRIGELQILSDAVEPDDLAVCGTQAWFAVQGRVYRVDLSDPGDLSVDMSLGDDIVGVDCGIGPGGSDGVLLESGGRVRYVTAGGAPVDEEQVPGARDVALGQGPDGPEGITCDTEGCSVIFWPYRAGSGGMFVRSDPDGTRGSEAGELVPLDAPHGRLSVADVDLDGNPDLLTLHPAAGSIAIHRSNGVSVLPAEVWHTGRVLAGAAGAHDGDGDGWPDLWMIDEDGDLKHTLSPLAAARSTGDTSTGR